MKESKTKKLTTSIMIISLYIVLTGLFASFSFGAIQIRISNILYGFAFLFPYLSLPLAIAVALSNIIFGGLGIIDMVFGSLTTFCVTFIIGKCKKEWQIIPVMIFGVAFGISLYLSKLLNIFMPILFIQIALGQVIPAVLSYKIIRRLR